MEHRYLVRRLARVLMGLEARIALRMHYKLRIEVLIDVHIVQPVGVCECQLLLVRRTERVLIHLGKHATHLLITLALNKRLIILWCIT